ncbi:hypothetical protein AgCh_010725 [Apium graveolens]
MQFVDFVVDFGCICGCWPRRETITFGYGGSGDGYGGGCHECGSGGGSYGGGCFKLQVVLVASVVVDLVGALQPVLQPLM